MMDNRGFNQLGEEILQSVQKAIDSMDFQQLNETISGTVNDALKEVRRKTGYDRGREESRGPEEERDPGYRPFQPASRRQERKNGSAADGRAGYGGRAGSAKLENPGAGVKEKSPPAIRVNLPGRVSSILYMVFGGVGVGVTGLLCLVVWLISLIVKPFWGAALGAGILLLAMGGVSGVMLGIGCARRGRIRRVKQYLLEIGDKTYVSVERLASGVGKSRKFVLKDLQKIIEKGILPDGHIDEQKTCLMLGEETYRQYLQAQESLKLREKEAIGFQKPQDISMEGLSPEMSKMMEAGREVLAHLREANEAIPGEVISAKISRLETVIRRIFETVRKHPEQAEDMERFMDYYLPTTMKLVDAYRDFDGTSINGENITSAKQEIEKALDTINQAFERLLDDLYQDAAFDAATDASVLQTMLKQDGWAGSDFAGKK